MLVIIIAAFHCEINKVTDGGLYFFKYIMKIIKYFKMLMQPSIDLKKATTELIF